MAARRYRYMMATRAHHPFFGDVSRKQTDLCIIEGEDGEHYIGRWVMGVCIVGVRFPKCTTRAPTNAERQRWNGKQTELGERPAGAIHIGENGVALSTPA